ncbi:MAG: 4Fe-4S dicluster domain-containing protein [Gemmatimonadales bacterium]|nr:MAG: 4Fe-4S dicluster domain-containing protein [Gemmatimonadales bacterium]
MAREEARLAQALEGQAERLSHCVHCGFCLPACPTYTRLGDEADSPRGRLHLMGAVLEGRLDPGADAFQEHLDRCLGCRACETVCPSGVEYGHLLERARQVAVAARPPSRLQQALLGAIGRRSVFLPWMWASRLFRASGLPAAAARHLPDRGLLGTVKLGSAMLAASAPSRSWRDRRPPPSPAHSEAESSRPAPRGRVAFLTGCVQDQLFHRVNQATRRVLEANGWEVVAVPDQGCCGALHAHGGRLDDARAMAWRNVRGFQDAGIDWIVANAAGCGAAMKEYGELLGEVDEGRGEEGEAFSHRVVDVTTLLAGEGRTPRVGAALPLRVAYDPPCHLLHAQRVSGPPERLLTSIPGIELVPLADADECCGGAGIYGITHRELGGEIGGDKAAAVEASGAEAVATGNPGCMMQIGAQLRLRGSPIPALHPIEILDESYRRAGFYPGSR